jgi:site-specific recombinase XerD
MADWLVTSKNGRFHVYGARKMVNGIPRDRLSWFDGEGKQRHTMLAVDKHDPKRAQRRAKQIAEELAKGRTESNLTRHDRLEILGAKDALFGTGRKPAEVCREYRGFLDSLEPTGKTPSEAVSDFLQRNPAQSATVEQVATELKAELERLGKSERYRRDQNLTLFRLCERFPTREIGSLGKTEMERFLEEWGGEPKTYNNHRGSLVTVFNWAMRKGYANRNPVSDLPKVKEIRSISCYSPEDIAAILAKCDENLLPWVLLQAFGCLRSAEVCRVEWGKHVDPVRGIIRATSAITKTGQTRIIEMQPNLVDWMIPLNRFSGPVYHGKTENGIGSTNRKRLAKAIEAAGVTPIPNGLRKACASHLIPQCDHIGAAAEMMGHTVSEMKQSYRELVSKEESDLYWSLTRQKVRKAA